MLFAAATSVFLLRSLGVERFGVYGVVAALLGIVSSLTEAGLTQVGTRDLPLRRPEDRQRLLSTLVAVRIALTSFGVLVAALVRDRRRLRARGRRPGRSSPGSASC